MATKRILTELVERAKAGDELANQYVQKQLTAYHGTPHDVDSSYSDLVDKAIDGGHDSLVIKNTYDGSGVLTDLKVVFDPSKIRSTQAAFDPAKKDSSNLLASQVGAGGAVGLGAMASEDAEAGALSKTFNYIHNLEKNPYKKDQGQFAMDVEPAGQYITPVDELTGGMEGYISGTKTFNNPLVLDFGGSYDDPSNWKRRLSEMYGGKTGKELTDAIRADGYDGILTKDDYGLSESVDLYKGKGGVDMASIAAPIATGLGATMLPSQKAEASEISDTPYQAQKETSPEKQAMLDKIFKNIVGAGEVGLSVGSGIASDAVAGLGGIYSGLTGGDAAATVEGLQDAAQLYTPRTEAGQAQLRGIADIIEETGQYWGPRGLDQSIENFRTSQDYLNRLGSRVDPRVGAAMATTLGILPEIL